MQRELSLAEALAAFQRGELERARELAADALSADPSSPQLQHLMGLIECRSGRIESGVDWLRRAAEAQPGNVAFRLMLVRALVDSGRANDALEAATAPSGTSSVELALWQGRAEAASAAGVHEQAIEAWQVLSTASPADWRLWTNLGRGLLALNRFDEAEQAYRRALASSPTELEVLRELGWTYERTNKREALAGLLDQALANGIGKDCLADLWAVRELREGRPEHARELLMKSDPGQDRLHWYRLKAKIADATDDAAEAFGAAVAMNHATGDFGAWRERAAAYRKELRALADSITPQWAAQLPRLAKAGRRTPAFLLGFPRSGTTLLDTFLMGHPETAVLEEKGLLQSLSEIIGPVGSLAECPVAAVEHARDTYFGLLGQHVHASFDRLVIDKAPLNMLMAPLIHTLFPGTPIIFVQRHPCDSVLSGFMQSFAPNLGMASFLDIGDAADFYDSAMSVWIASRQALPLNVHIVVYEDLVRDPEAALRPLLSFLGLGWSDRLLDHRATAKARGTIRNTSYDQVTESLTQTASGRWRRYQTQLEPVLPVLLPWAERLGYR